MGPKNLIQRWTKNIFGFYRFTFEVDPFKEHAWLWLSKKNANKNGCFKKTRCLIEWNLNDNDDAKKQNLPYKGVFLVDVRNCWLLWPRIVATRIVAAPE